MNMTTARLTTEGTRVTAAIGVKGADIDRALGTAVAGNSDRLALDTAAPAITAWVACHVTVTGTDDRTCVLGDPPRLAADGDGVAVTLAWDCADVPSPLIYRSTLLTDVDPAARQIVLIGPDDNPAQAMLDVEHDTLTLSMAELGLEETVPRYVETGI